MTTGTASYERLLTTYKPQTIKSEDDYERVVMQLNQLLDKVPLSPEEEELLSLLGTLIASYEQEHFPDEAFELRGVILLKALMDEQGLKQKDLVPIFKSRSIISEVLNGKRGLTVEHIDQLAHYFALPHSCFFDNSGP